MKTMVKQWYRIQLFKWMVCICLYMWIGSVDCLADERKNAGSDEFLYISPVYDLGELAIEPPEILEKAGKRYKRISKNLKTVESEGVLTYVSTKISYELEENQEPPQSAMAMMKDPTTGKEYEREIVLLEVKEIGEEWRSDFDFLITVSRYDAERFFLDDTEIPKETDLLDYQEQFLHHLGLSQDFYRVSRLEWDGEPYENEGILCRNAIASGDKKIRIVEATYGGQVRTPNVPGKQYEALYEEIQLDMEIFEPIENEEKNLMGECTKKEEIVVSESEQELKLQDRSEQRDDGEEILQWLKEHIQITMLGGLFFVCMAGWLLLIRLSGKKEREEKAES